MDVVDRCSSGRPLGLDRPAAGGSSERPLAVLVGVDADPLVLPWASLATIVWLDRCSRSSSCTRPWLPFSWAVAAI